MNQGATEMWGEYMSALGTRVRALRLSKRLNQTQLAELAGMSQAAIAKIETGATKSVTGVTLEALARVLSSTGAFLLNGAKDEDEHEESMVIAEIADIFRGLTLEDKQTILRIARGLVHEKPVHTKKVVVE